MTASHWPEYTAKVIAASQGPGRDKVVRRRADQLGTPDRMRVAPSAGTALAITPAMVADNAAMHHHQLRQPKCSIHSGPASRPSAAPRGMYVPQRPSIQLIRRGATTPRSSAGPGSTT